jgi:uncharacterized protein YjdB
MDKKGPRSASILICVIVLVLSMGLAGCGGGGSSSTTSTVAKITLTPATATVGVGQSQSYFAALADVDNNEVSAAVAWASSATNVATIDSNGVATGVSAGTTQITATSNGITSNAVTLTVTTRVASVSIAPLSSTVAVNGTRQFTATALDTQGNPVPGISISWYCSFVGVATIDNNGLVTGVSPGTVTIVASAGPITSQPAALTVTP